jgi:hypothetical protein
VHLLGNSHYEIGIPQITKPKLLQENYAQYDFDYRKQKPSTKYWQVEYSNT